MIKKLFLNDNNVLLLIILNAGIIFLGGFNLDEKNNFILSLADNLVTSLFILEIAIKFTKYGRCYLSSNWNKFDFALILLSIPALIAFIFQINLHDFSFLLVFRVLRVLKSFRFIKFIPGIDHLINGIKRALRASLIVILGFFVYIFIVGILSFNLFKESAPEYFSNPIVSLYSTFKIFTIEGWFEIPEQVTKGLKPGVSFITYLYFIFIVLSGGILGLSIVNSIFVDAMVSDNNDELEKKIDNLEQKIDQLLTKSQNQTE